MTKIVVLIGNICSGKTVVAKIFEKQGYFFFPVESCKKTIKFTSTNKDRYWKILYAKYSDEIIKLSSSKKLIVESTGANKFWMPCFKKIKKHFGKDLIVIKVDSDLDVCLKRFKKNKIDHRKNTKEELLRTIDKTLKKKKIPYDISIKNNGTLSDFKQKIKEKLFLYVS